MPNSEDRSAAFLEASVKAFKIFIDTCSLLSEQADIFWSHIVPILQREEKSIIVPFRVRDEQNRRKEQPANTVNGNQKSFGHLKGAKTIAR